MSNRAIVKPHLIEWALERAEVSRHDLATAVGTTENVVDTWLTGEKYPTFRQSRLIATRTRIPFGFLFLQQPPPETLPIPDFRIRNGESIGSISVDLRDVILSTLRKQAWLSEFLEAIGEDALDYVGSASDNEPSVAIAESITQTLSLPQPLERPRNAEAFLRLLVERSEAVGVNVLRSGIVGTNTRRTLDVDEFRGFSLSDRFAPFIFVNSTDVRVAQVFTLVHELGHIWLGQSGISDVLGSSEVFSGANDESLCNRIAAEVLVPHQDFRDNWNSDVEPIEAVKAASRRLHVSRYVVALRALELGMIDRPTLNELLETFREDWRGRPRSPGGDFYRTSIARNGRSFTSTVLQAANNQQLLYKDAARLLDVKPSNLDGIANELTGAR